jgi:hypothetical protein
VWALLLGATGTAAAQRTPTCIEVQAVGVPDRDRDALRALIRSDLERRDTHAPADDCRSELRVELLEVEGRRFLTGRINWQVPQRVEVEEGELPEAVGELLDVLYHNDPVRLPGPEDERGLLGALGRLRRHGASLFGIEVFQTAALVEGDPEAIPGLAFRMRRELLRFHVGFRIAFAARPSRPPRTLALRGVGELTLELAWFSSDGADAAFYVAGLFGLAHHWLRGPRHDDPNLFDEANSTGLVAGGRLGVELLRTTRTRLDLFVAVLLPLFPTRDEERQVIGSWLPTLSAGAGIHL